MNPNLPLQPFFDARSSCSSHKVSPIHYMWLTLATLSIVIIKVARINHMCGQTPRKLCNNDLSDGFSSSYPSVRTNLINFKFLDLKPCLSGLQFLLGWYLSECLLWVTLQFNQSFGVTQTKEQVECILSFQHLVFDFVHLRSFPQSSKLVHFSY